MCQCPKRAYSISTKLKMKAQKYQEICVNALNGLTPFLQNTSVMQVMILFMCQCPKRAYSISTTICLYWFDFAERCQCPKRAYSISTDKIQKNMLDILKQCQCPKRAYSISTAASGSPHKHWLPGHIFAGICLNILISPVFQPFFGLFTICSYFTRPNPPHNEAANRERR